MPMRVKAPGLLQRVWPPPHFGAASFAGAMNASLLPGQGPGLLTIAAGQAGMDVTLLAGLPDDQQ